MSFTALQIAAQACNDAGLDQTLSSFSMSESPYNSLLDIMNSAIGDMNRAGNYSFGETSSALTYSGGVSSYNLNTVASNAIEPRRIIRLRRELSGAAGELTECAFSTFQNKFRTGTIPTMCPTVWSKYGSTLYLSSIPDKDYTLTLYYYQPIQPIVVGTNDTLATIVPDYHLDVLRDLIKVYLLKEMGSPEFGTQYPLAIRKVAALVAKSQQDVGIPSQLPRAF